VFKGAADPKDVPELGEDYSDEVTDGSTSTVAVLDSLDTWANWDAVFICTPVPADAFTVTVSAGNDNASTLTCYYRKNDNTWADTSATDNTKVGSDTLQQNGTITWSAPSDEAPMYMFGIHGYWYQWRVSAALDGEVEISSVTFQSPTFVDVENVWDGVPVDGIEVFVETGSGTAKYENYGASAVDIDSLASGSDIHIACTDPIEGIYIDVGAVPHTGTAITFTINYWTGSAWSSVGTVNDSTDGLFHSGWLRFPRQTAQPKMDMGTNYYAYWYQITTGAAAATSEMNIGIQVMPYFSISDFGQFGQTNACWREHACYTWTAYPEYVYIAMANQPLVLNGTEYGILEAGDGRSNKVLCMRPLFNNLLVWQQEKGVEGGTTTIFQGYDPTTYGKLIISSRVGIVNSKAAVVVEGVQTSAQSEERFGSGEDIAKGTYAFWVSRYGVMCTDGRTIWVISDDIQNYFDMTETTTCLRRGYESEHWIMFDSTYNVLRLGLVCGASATKPNIFPIFDLTDKVWYFDSLGQPLSCAIEIESGSGNLPITSIGGGTADGTVYILNTGTEDVSTAITSYVDIILNHENDWLVLTELLFRCKVQAAGDVTVTTYENEVQKDSFALSMTAQVTNDSTRRHREQLNCQGSLLKVRLQHATASQTMELQDVGFSVQIWEGK
jgi:hypothetical protein